MATGTVRTTDYLVNTAFPSNTTGLIGADDAQDGAETAGALPHSTQTASYTAALTDRGTCIEMNVASANNFTIPTNASVAFPIDATLTVCQYGAGQTTIVPASGVTIRTPSSLTTRVQYSTVFLRKRATNEWVISGDLT
jgi:hypothetical protein